MSIQSNNQGYEVGHTVQAHALMFARGISKDLFQKPLGRFGLVLDLKGIGAFFHAFPADHKEGVRDNLFTAMRSQLPVGVPPHNLSAHLGEMESEGNPYLVERKEMVEV